MSEVHGTHIINGQTFHWSAVELRTNLTERRLFDGKRLWRIGQGARFRDDGTTAQTLVLRSRCWCGETLTFEIPALAMFTPDRKAH